MRSPTKVVRQRRSRDASDPRENPGLLRKTCGERTRRCGNTRCRLVRSRKFPGAFVRPRRSSLDSRRGGRHERRLRHPGLHRGRGDGGGADGGGVFLKIEVTAWTGWLTEWILVRAARKLPLSERDPWCEGIARRPEPSPGWAAELPHLGCVHVQQEATTGSGTRHRTWARATVSPSMVIWLDAKEQGRAGEGLGSERELQ